MENKKRIIVYVICFILMIGVVLSLNILTPYKKNNYQLNMNIERNDNITNPINYSEIITKVRDEYNNDDIKGILEIVNADYIVPVLQGKDNDYYLNHDAYGKHNYMGSIYLDYRVNIDSSKKLLIYGHNSSNIDMPFKILEEFYDKDYYDNHKYVIFSVYVEPTDYSYMNINFNNDDEYFDHLKKLKSKSMYDTGINISKDDEILILQTCSTNKDYRNYQKKYLLIILRRV